MPRTKKLPPGTAAGVLDGLSKLMSAGMPADAALEELAGDGDGIATPVLSKMLGLVRTGGYPLSKAVDHSLAFPGYAGSMLAIGERTGNLPEALSSVAGYCRTTDETRKLVRSAMLRPLAMLALVLAVVLVVLVKVLPVFDGVYASMGTGLSGFAATCLAAGNWIAAHAEPIMALACLVLCVAACVAFIPPIRKYMTGLWKASHYDKGLSLELLRARFAQSMAMCMSSGMDVQTAAAFTGSVVSGMGSAEDKCRKLSHAVASGTKPGEAMRELGLLSRRDGRALDVAYKTGSHVTEMKRIADGLVAKLPGKISGRIGMVEPMAIIAGSLLMLAMLASVMVPLLSVAASLG